MKLIFNIKNYTLKVQKIKFNEFYPRYVAIIEKAYNSIILNQFSLFKRYVITFWKQTVVSFYWKVYVHSIFYKIHSQFRLYFLFILDDEWKYFMFVQYGEFISTSQFESFYSSSIFYLWIYIRKSNWYYERNTMNILWVHACSTSLKPCLNINQKQMSERQMFPAS